MNQDINRAKPSPARHDLDGRRDSDDSGAASFAYHFSGLDYSKLAKFQSAMADAVKDGTLSGLSNAYSKNDVEVHFMKDRFTSGMVIAAVRVFPKLVTGKQLCKILDTSGQDNRSAIVQAKVAGLPGIHRVLSTGKTLMDVDVYCTAPSVEQMAAKDVEAARKAAEETDSKAAEKAEAKTGGLSSPMHPTEVSSRRMESNGDDLAGKDIVEPDLKSPSTLDMRDSPRDDSQDRGPATSSKKPVSQKRLSGDTRPTRRRRPSRSSVSRASSAESSVNGNVQSHITPCATPGCPFQATWHETHCCDHCRRFGTQEHGPRCARARKLEARSESERGVELTANEDVQSLGITVSTALAAGYPSVMKVISGSWAESVGIQQGDLVLKVNGHDLCDLPKEDLGAQLKVRPLVLYLDTGAPPGSADRHCAKMRSSRKAAYRKSTTPDTPTWGTEDENESDPIVIGTPKWGMEKNRGKNLDRTLSPPEEEPSPQPWAWLPKESSQTESETVRGISGLVWSPPRKRMPWDAAEPMAWKSVTAGVVLVCIVKSDEGAADIWESATGSIAIDVVQCGGCVMAAGPCEEIAPDVLMVPIEPKGAVEAAYFKPVMIRGGTQLVCRNVEADVWCSLTSSHIAGIVKKGECIVAAGRAQKIANMVIVPIHPRGAIELDSFRLLYTDQVNDQADGSVLNKKWANPANWIGPGHVLECIGQGNFGCAFVHKSWDCEEVIGSILPGDRVVVSGTPRNLGGIRWAPIEPRGIVALPMFQFAEEPDRTAIANPSSTEQFLSLSHWLSEAGGPLPQVLKITMGKKEDLVFELQGHDRSAVPARAFGRQLVDSWLRDSDHDFALKLKSARIDLRMRKAICALLSYLEWAVSYRVDLTSDFLFELWSTMIPQIHESGRLPGQFADMDDAPSPLLFEASESPAGLGKLLAQELLPAENRLILEFCDRLEEFYGSVYNGLQEVIGGSDAGLSRRAFTENLSFLCMLGETNTSYVTVAADLFDILDVNGNGMLTRKEWIEAFSVLGEENKNYVVLRKVLQDMGTEVLGDRDSQEQVEDQQLHRRNKRQMPQASMIPSSDQSNETGVAASRAPRLGAPQNRIQPHVLYESSRCFEMPKQIRMPSLPKKVQMSKLRGASVSLTLSRISKLLGTRRTTLFPIPGSSKQGRIVKGRPRLRSDDLRFGRRNILLLTRPWPKQASQMTQ